MKILGNIISGSLADGLIMRINPDANIEALKTGKFVSINGDQNRFFSLITDLKLEVSNPEILLFPPNPNEKTLLNILKKRDIYATAIIKPMIMVDKNNNVMPVKTIPPHFTPVYEAQESDIALIFGDEKAPSKKYFNNASFFQYH